jgi:hypothetical protein
VPACRGKYFWVVLLLAGLFVVFARIPLLATSSDNNASPFFKPLLADVSQGVPIGQLNSPLETPSLAVRAFEVEDQNSDPQDDVIPDTVAIVCSVLVLMALAGYSLLLNDCWLRRLGRVYHPTLERPG